MTGEQKFVWWVVQKNDYCWIGHNLLKGRKITFRLSIVKPFMALQCIRLYKNTLGML